MKDEKTKIKDNDDSEKSNDNSQIEKTIKKYPFSRHRKRRSYEKIEHEILVAISLNKLVTTSKIAQLTGLDTIHAKKHLEMMEIKGLISRFKKGCFESWSYWSLPTQKEKEVE
jgi:predicted transcriptional regulator